MTSLILEVGNYLILIVEASMSGVGLGGVSFTIQNSFNAIVRNPLFFIFSASL